MARVFYRSLAIPLWMVVFFAGALASQPPATRLQVPFNTLFVIALFGIAVLVATMPGALLWSRPSRSFARVNPSTDRDKASRSVMAARISVRTLHEPKENTQRADVLDLARMDDDGGWQLLRAPV
jgi:hypothetical protein